MRIPPGYLQSSKVLKLNKVLYSLRWSFSLWQQKLTNEIKKLGFKEIFQKSCIIQKYKTIGFFYVDNIIFVFKKNRDNEVNKIVELLSQVLTIKIVNKLK